MRRRVSMVAVLATLCVIHCAPLRADAEPASPKPNQTEPQNPHWQLFLDDYIIERSTGFRRVVHHPEPRGVVLPPDEPWETQGLSVMYVGRRKDGRLECYYRVHGKDIPNDTTAYASRSASQSG